MTEWFEQWFGEEYLRLYPHRDDDDAARLTALVARHTDLQGGVLLDLACGAGRHASLFRSFGARVVGFDLSMPLLSRARYRNGNELALVRGDMRRLPFGDAAFDVVTNLFTSFGYFTDDAQHAAVLRDAVRTLRTGGTFVLDYMNAIAIRESLVLQEEAALGNERVIIERRISPDEQYVVKEIHLVDDGRSFVERVRLFAPAQLRTLMTDAGLTVDDTLGDYEGRAFVDTSPRVILFGSRR